MRPARISGADPKPLGAPADWNEETNGHCGALFIRRERLDGIDYMRSAWEVEAEEAALMLAGASLTLGVQGHAHPVVHLQIGNLPDVFEPIVTARRFVDLKGRPSVRVEMIYPHGGGRRAYSNVLVLDQLAPAVAIGVDRIEALAKAQGWIK